MSVKIAKRSTPAAIAVLRQATAIAPKRKKASDGLLPSAAHQVQNSKSDHNTGHAVDLTHDPLGGIDCKKIFQFLKSDPRVTYLIFQGKIWAKDRADEGDRVYTGPNKHPHHLHISINPKLAEDTSPWFAWLGEPKVLAKVKAKIPKPLPKKKDVPSQKENNE